MTRKEKIRRVYMFILSTAALLFLCSCEAAGIGTTVRLEGVSMYLDGKLISGLPSQKADIVLKVPLSEVSISSTSSETIIKLKPGDAIIIVKPDGVSINGIDPQKVKIEWHKTDQSK